MVLPMLAGLLPGLAMGAKRFMSGVAGDLMAGKGLGQSLKENALKTAEGIIPGAGSIIKGAVEGAKQLMQGRRRLPRTTGPQGRLQQEIQTVRDKILASGYKFPVIEEAVGAGPMTYDERTKFMEAKLAALKKTLAEIKKK